MLKCYLQKKALNLGIPWWSSGQDMVFFTPKGPSSIPSWGTKTPEAVQCSQKKNKTLNTKANTTGKILDKFITLSAEELLVNQILISYLYEHTHVYIYT